MVVATKKSDILDLMARGRKDYSWYMTHVLDVNPDYLWSGMRNVNDSVRDFERTSVPAGHGVSKTYNAARVALTFLMCYYPSTVVTTAPTGNQVKNLLWREIRQAHANARIPLGGKPTATMLDLQAETGVKWFAIGFSTKPDTVTLEATAFQGYHNDYLLVIFDEAAGVMAEIWRAAEFIGAPFKRFLAIGNPTSQVGDFAESIDDPTYNHVRISVKDTPNFKEGKVIIPGVYGREYEERIRLKYGEDSDQYRVRVLGLKSRRGAEGAYYGETIGWLTRHERITQVGLDRSVPVYTVWDPGYTTAVWFFQPRGLDIAFVRAYEESGLNIGEWSEILRGLKDNEGYRFGGHFAPVDIDSNATRGLHGKSWLEEARENGINMTILEPEHRVVDGIDRTKKFLNTCYFDKQHCERGIKALKWYCEKKARVLGPEEEPVFTGHPDDTYWGRHLCDAMRYASIAVNKLPTASNEAEIAKYRRLAAEHRRPT